MHPNCEFVQRRGRLALVAALLAGLFGLFSPLDAQDAPGPADAEPTAQADTQPADTEATEGSEEAGDEAVEAVTMPPLGSGNGRRTLPEELPENAEVLFLPFRRQVDEILLFSLRRGFQQAKEMDNLVAIVLDMNTPGGRVDITRKIMDLMVDEDLEVPVYLFVNNEATSAGAIVGFASDGIFMKPTAQIGAAAPVIMGPQGAQDMPDKYQGKIDSYVKAMVRSMADYKGHMPLLAEAMVDQEVEVKIGDRVVSPEGELLTLTANEATEVIPPMEQPLLAEAIVQNREDLLQQLGLAEAKVVHFELTGGAVLARYIMLIAPILMTVGILGLYMEVQSPGFGVPGAVGITAFVVLLMGQFFAGMSGLVEAVLLLLGVLLLLAELFVIPGFGIAGFGGLACILASFIMMFIPQDLPSVPENLEDWEQLSTLPHYASQGLITLTIALVLTGLGGYAIGKLLPHTSLYGSLVLQSATSAEAGYVANEAREYRETLVGAEGEALTDLRPGGTARINGKRMDVSTVGDYITKGERIRVCRVNGPSISVEQAPAAESSGEEQA